MQNKNQSEFNNSEGGLKALFFLSFPLMISALASLFMIFVDRCFLSHYSLESFNASVNAGTLAWAFLGGLSLITSSSQIFVAQYNGARRFEQLGKPVWQMIWLAVLSAGIFLPLAFIGPSLFFHGPYKALEGIYFKILILFAPIYAMQLALNGFYVGRGKTKFILIVALLANIVNGLLDWAFIFGIPNVLQPMGIEGAALATFLGTVFHTTVLFTAFLKKRNRTAYKTQNASFDKSLFTTCFKIGFPQGLFYTFEILGWAVFFQMMSALGTVHITISSICQSIIILFTFFFDGLWRGVSSLTGNYIGQSRISLINKTFFSGLKLQLIFCLGISFFFFIKPDILVYSLISNQHAMTILSNDGAQALAFNSTLNLSLICVFGYLFFNGIRWILAGILSAAGDTLFLLISGSISIWLLFIIPVYFLVLGYTKSITIAWILAANYAFSLGLLNLWRYLKGKWKSIDLINSQKQQAEVIVTDEQVQADESDEQYKHNE